MDAHTEPIHGVAVTWQGAEHRIDGGGNGPTGLKVVAEGRGRGFVGKFLVEEQVNHVLGLESGQFSNRVTAVVNSFFGGDERGTTGTHRNATHARVEVLAGDGEQVLVVAHGTPSGKPTGRFGIKSAEARLGALHSVC